MARVVVVGAGIVGLALGARLAARGDDVTVVDKADELAAHQTGRNSGVVHSGLYYAPGSLKARYAAAGAVSMVEYARSRGVAVEVTGKLVVAVTPDELGRLATLEARGRANGVPLARLTPAEAREVEPHVACVAALRVDTTGIVDYRGVCAALAADITAAGGRVLLGTPVIAARTTARGVQVLVGHGERPQDRETLEADLMVACGGLHADRLARASGVEPDARIVPFRGEYFELTPRAAALVRGLIYPVPDPQFPFLGVHLTRSVEGGVHVGPNAVLALAREGYTWRDISPTDVADALSWPGLWRLGAKAWRPGAREVARSLSRRLFAESLARLVPGITQDDLVPAPAGVRAQALQRDGSMVDDFLVRTGPRQVHVLNAPSPAATAALEIATHLERMADDALALALR